ncbi:hypothetical protein [Infirmifilum sp.]
MVLRRVCLSTAEEMLGAGSWLDEVDAQRTLHGNARKPSLGSRGDSIDP